MGLAEASAEMPEGSRKDASHWTGKLVEQRMIEAMEYLRRTASLMRRPSPFAKDGPWGEIIANTNAMEATQDQPADYVKETVGELFDRLARERGGYKAAEVERHEEALDWIAIVPARGDMRPLVGIVLEQKVHCARVDWSRVRRDLGRGDTHDVLRMSFTRAMDKIASTLTRRRVPVSL